MRTMSSFVGLGVGARLGKFDMSVGEGMGIGVAAAGAGVGFVTSA